MTVLIDTRNPPELTFFPETTIDEIVQNVYCILQTYKNQVPCYRQFGVDSEWLHRPMNVAKQLWAVGIADALRNFEPRVNVESFNFGMDETDPTGAYVEMEVSFDEE